MNFPSIENAITGAIQVASIHSTSVNTQLTLSHIARKIVKSIKNRRDTEHTTNVDCAFTKRKFVLHLSNFFFCCHSVDDFRRMCVCVCV